jgi:hypothetical protein
MTDETRARFLAGIAAQLPVDRITEVHVFSAIRQGGMESGVAVIAVAPAFDDAPIAAERFTVYTARYRHTLKGPDRGKWELSVVDEADAPLLTVDAVVRGVSRRSGDAGDTSRLTGDEFRAAVSDPARS